MSQNAAQALYREVVLDHHRHPRGNRPLPDPDVSAAGKNPACGDEVTLQLDFDGDRIAAVGVLSRGCAIATSSGSMLAEIIEGLTIADAEKVAALCKQALKGDATLSAATAAGHSPATHDADSCAHAHDTVDDTVALDIDLGDLEALTGVRKFPVRIKCALLPWVTLLDAILAHRQGRQPEPVSTEHGAMSAEISERSAS